MFSNFFYNLQENALPRQSNETKDGKGSENSCRPKVDWFAILKNRAHIGRTPYYNISKFMLLVCLVFLVAQSFIDISVLPRPSLQGSLHNLSLAR